MAFASNALGTYLAHSTLRQINCDLKSICITNVIAELPITLSDFTDIEFNSINCSSHSTDVFRALLALQETRELLTCQSQITGTSAGSTHRIVQHTPTTTGNASLTTNLPTERDRLLDILLDGKVYYLQADWIPFPPNGNQTAQPLCAHTMFSEDGDCSNNFELTRIRITRNFDPSATTIGTPQQPALSLTALEPGTDELIVTTLTICPNEAYPQNSPRYQEKIPPAALSC
jgi:hypothetical protein